MSPKLVIKFISGKVQRNTEVFGKMELFVYAKLTAGNGIQEGKIEWVRGAMNEQVHWGQEIVFNLLEQDYKTARLFLQVRDEDLTSDDIVGQTWLNLYNCGLVGSDPEEIEVTLFYEHTHAGVVRLITRLVN